MSNHIKKAVLLGLVAIATAGGGKAIADQGGIVDFELKEEKDVSIEFGAVSVIQHADDSDIDDDATLSADLLVTKEIGTGTVLVHIEGASQVRENHVSEVIPDANADAGTASTGGGDGRIQLSEIHYTWEAARGFITMGLVDPAAFFDTSEVANDETTQFLSASLVNNPSIGFPDYTLGAVAGVRMSETNLLQLMVAGSHGLGDNEHRYYNDLLNLDEKGKGVFSSLEFERKGGGKTARIGGWLNGAMHPYADGSEQTAYNYGIYGLLEGAVNDLKWNVRAGIANPDVATVCNFISVAGEQQFEAMAFGIGLGWGRINLTNNPGEKDEAAQAEVYARFDLPQGFHLTPSIQWIQHGGMGKADSTIDDMVVVGLRLGWNFIY